MLPRAARVLSLLLLLPGAAWPQQSEPPQIVGVRVGFADHYKVGFWTPVEVALRGGTEKLTGQLVLSVPDSDGVSTRVMTEKPGMEDDSAEAEQGSRNSDSTQKGEPPVELLPGRETRVTLYVRFGQAGSPLKAEFLVQGVPVARRTFETADQADAGHFLRPIQARSLVVQVGADRMGMEEAAALEKTAAQSRAVVARLTEAAQLPTRWYGYEGVDALVLSTSERRIDNTMVGPEEIYRHFKPGSDLANALDQWIRMGGRLVLCVGSQGDKALERGLALAAFAPGEFQRVVSLPQTTALEAYAGSSTVMGTANAQAPIRVSRLIGLRGRVEAAEADLPLVVRTPRGLGQVLFVAADLDQPPLNKWADRKLLAAKLLDLPAADPPGEKEPGMHYGFTDLAGQLRSALDQFNGVRIVPFSKVAVLVLFYILLIGPGDYFFLRRFLRRMEWTWATFPLIVVVTCVGAYSLARLLKGDQVRVCQADVIDFDTDSGRVRGTSWMNVFSPRTQSFDLSLRGRLPGGKADRDAECVIAWLGLHGDGLGGMQRGSNAVAAAIEGVWYDFKPGLDSIQGVPIQVWATKSLTARWSVDSESPVKANLSAEGHILTGTITNNLDVPLTDCILAFEGGAYQLGTIEAGKSADLGDFRPANLRTLLAGRKYLLHDKNASEEGVTPYDHSSTDVAYILRAMMFFEAAGGQSYTRLANDDQRFIDLTGLLKAGRAVLVARPPQGPAHRGAELLRDDQPLAGPQDAHTSVYRFVLPVESKKQETGDRR